MINLARIYAVDRDGAFMLVDVPKKQARDKKRELERLGFTLTHTELV